MIQSEKTDWFNRSRWARATMLILAGCGFAIAASCADGEDVLFDNAAGKGGSAGHAGSSSGSSGNNGGASGSGQSGSGGTAGSAQGGAGQGGAGRGGAGQGGVGQGGTAGSSGSAGAGGNATDAGMDAPTTACTVPAIVGTPVSGQGVTLKYLDGNMNATDNSIQFRIQIIGAASIPLSGLEVRYYFTNEATTGPYTLDLFYGGLMGGPITDKIQRTLVAMGPVIGADAYISYKFDASAGTLTSGGTIDFNPGFHKTDYQANFNECNDYSYDPTAFAYKDNPRIAVFRNGTLIWGAPPVGATPEGGTDAAPGDAAAEAATTDASSDASIDQSAADAAVESASDAAAGEAGD